MKDLKLKEIAELCDSFPENDLKHLQSMHQMHESIIILIVIIVNGLTPFQ